MTFIRRQRPLGFPTFMDEIFNNDFRTTHSTNESNPAVNIIEIENGYELEIAAPGFKKDEFSLEVDNDTLTIFSKHKEEKVEKGKESKFTRREFSYKNFRRSFTLPENVDQNNISAKYNEGILQVSIPQKEVEVKKVKQIKIG